MENQQLLCEELLAVADKINANILSILPDDPVMSFTLFVEATRVYDSWALSYKYLNWDKNQSMQYLDLMGLGYNQFTYYYLKELKIPGFPIAKSTIESREYVTGILYELGCTSMIRRSVDMIKTGMLEVEKVNNNYIFKSTTLTEAQYLDSMEFTYYSELEEQIKLKMHEELEGWKILRHEEYLEHLQIPGNFHATWENKTLPFIIENIEERMAPLIAPWPTSQGIIISYSGTEEIDFHFLAIATDVVREWRADAGLSHEIILYGINAVDLDFVVTVLVSFCLKHAGFTKIADATHPDINIPMSLTLWTPKHEMIHDIAFFTKIEQGTVEKIFEMIMFKPSEVAFLKNNTNQFVPLLIDMGNGYVLRPLSGILYNPYYSLISLMEYRDPNVRHTISEPREQWIRSELYAIFSGTRYQTIDGNIKLKQGNNTVTDLDAVIYDTLTGELAIFQIKWQDYFFNDVKKLRSKASNLVRELEEWSEKTDEWIKAHGTKEFIKALRLKLEPTQKINNVYLFGLSRTKARMQGFGFRSSSEILAIANWPQFSRNRFLIGPAPRVFYSLHKALKEQQEGSVRSRPLPVEWNVGGITLKYANLYNAFE